MAMRYGYERGRDGWDVWLLAEHTGDKRDLIDTVDTEAEAQRLIDELYEKQAAALNERPRCIEAARAVVAKALGQ